MNALIVYDSAYGNTAKVAKAIAGTVSEKYKTITKLVAEIKPGDVEVADLLIVGSPTQGGRPTKPVEEFLKSLPAGLLHPLKVAAFDTRFAIKEQGFGLKMLMRTIGFAAPKISAMLKAKRGTVVMEPEGFIVSDMKGPLKEGELERAKAWGRKVIR
jgi:flavodoxin I